MSENHVTIGPSYSLLYSNTTSFLVLSTIGILFALLFVFFFFLFTSAGTWYNLFFTWAFTSVFPQEDKFVFLSSLLLPTLFSQKIVFSSC